jgi:benzoyl-CoA reductase/2-hydroxyglutaryl-CoA dehydratase subunit BcrC/BadD/HgdB
MSSDNPLGPTVGLFSPQVPRELFYALGCTPVRVFPSAGKPTAAEAFLPRNFCALNRLILASFLENSVANLDAVIFADEDDATRRLYDVWRACVPVPVWGFVEVPRTATPLAANHYAGILTRTATDLEACTGRSLSTGSLHQAIAVYNQQRSLLADLKRHWLSGSVDTTAYRRLRRMALTRDPVTANEQLWQTLKETEGGEKAPSVPPPSRRLLLLGELAVPAGLVRLVEARGARVVAEDSDLDERDLMQPVPAEAKTVEGTLAALANAYLSKPPGPRMRDLPRRLAHLSQLVAERGVQAAICAYSKFCDLYLAEFPILKAHLERLGIPVLLLELEDDSLSGQHRTRVEAFLEMLNEG